MSGDGGRGREALLLVTEWVEEEEGEEVEDPVMFLGCVLVLSLASFISPNKHTKRVTFFSFSHTLSFSPSLPFLSPSLPFLSLSYH